MDYEALQMLPSDVASLLVLVFSLLVILSKFIELVAQYTKWRRGGATRQTTVANEIEWIQQLEAQQPGVTSYIRPANAFTVFCLAYFGVAAPSLSAFSRNWYMYNRISSEHAVEMAGRGLLYGVLFAIVPALCVVIWRRRFEVIWHSKWVYPCAALVIGPFLGVPVGIIVQLIMK